MSFNQLLWHMKTVHTQIRLPLKEQFEKGLQSLPFYNVFCKTNKKKKKKKKSKFRLKKYGIKCLKFQDIYNPSAGFA